MHHQSPTQQSQRPHIALAISFVRAIEDGGDPFSFVTSDVVEEEMPNRVFPLGKVRELEAMRTGASRGREIFRRQGYAVESAYEDGDVAVLEISWTGELAKPLGALMEGATMRAKCAFFFQVQNGKIARIRHYDCFEPF